MRANAGSQRLVRSAATTAREAALASGITEPERRRRQSQAVEMRLWRLSPGVASGRPWTPGEVALPGTLPDWEGARRLGRSLPSVTQKRTKRGIANPLDARKRGRS